MSPRKSSAPLTNRLLAALPKREYQRLLPALEPVTLTFGDILFEPGDRLRHVYFPHNSIVSLLCAVDGRERLEVGIVGNDGMAGLPVFMGVNRSRTRGLVQGAGDALRMKAAALVKEVGGGGPLHKLLHRYTHSLLTQISQSAACNRFHQVNARLARWLLMTHDRVEGDEFRLTQEFISHMLGVRREQVTLAASALQKQKLISYSRGRIKILDRAGLEAISCGCYAAVKKEYDDSLKRA
ncbi:MAG TPA: Crp/Fnr family transcriptional regulator [Pyrinomonadaceae bacterium]|jgi:CRP-like cAMP-binding protein|nr:Crp/Fnr family transcriptional regulator [Pyrinomonadaceae bacterium]